MGLVLPLDVEGVTLAGLWLRASALVGFPDEAVLFQLEYGRPGMRSRTPLMRLEWRPLSRPHRNPLGGPAAHAGLLIPGTHLHPSELNWVPANQAMRSGNLPFALAVEPDFNRFEECVDWVGRRFNTLDLTRLARPGWQARLL